VRLRLVRAADALRREDAELVEAVSGMVHAGGTWALDLFRSAGFTIGPGERQPDGMHRRVWIEQQEAPLRILH
jgi:hypothetical protein